MTVKILFHLNQAGYGGTEKAIYTFCENLDKSRFQPCLFIYQTHSRYKYYRDRLLATLSGKANRRFNTRYVASRARLPDFIQLLGRECVFEGREKEFEQVVSTLSPDVIHFNQGKWQPFFDELIDRAPPTSVCVETSIFGYPASGQFLDRLARVYFVSRWLLQKSSWCGNKGEVLYNPIRKPANCTSIREQLGIPENAFVVGRISRPDLADDNFILDVFNGLDSSVYLIILAGSDVMREAAQHNDRIRLIPATTDESLISGFYNSIDLLLHYRIEGETFGMNIAEAMIHGKPVISHVSDVDNAQAELLEETAQHGTVGYVVARDDREAYQQHITDLMHDRELLATIGMNAKSRAQQLFQEDIVTRYLEDEYVKLLSGLKCR